MKIGYQLYSCRNSAMKNLSAVLHSLAEFGYDGVELAGFCGHKPEELREMMGREGLRAVSSHVPLAAWERDAEQVIREHRILGCEYLVIPYLDEEYRPGNPAFSDIICRLFEWGERTQEAGMQLLYHNHDFEFREVSGKNGLDFLMDSIPSKCLLPELDTCWIKYAGFDPGAYIQRYKGQCPVVHLKDYLSSGKEGEVPYGLLKEGTKEESQKIQKGFSFKPLGYGCQDIGKLVEASEESGAQWLVVEQDEPDKYDELEAAALSIETLKRYL